MCWLIVVGVCCVLLVGCLLACVFFFVDCGLMRVFACCVLHGRCLLFVVNGVLLVAC